LEIPIETFMTMEFVTSLFEGAQPGLFFPNHLFGWLGWFAMLALLGWGILHWREELAPVRERWWIGLALLALAPLLACFVGFRLPGALQPMPNTPLELPPPAMMILSAIPWALAGGLLGPLPAVVLALLSGLLIGVYETHNPFTPLEMGILALLFSAAVRQNYRTRFYRFLRHPLGAVLVVLAAYVPLIIWGSLFSTNDSLAVRLDYAFTQAWLVYAARAGELLAAGLIAELVFLLVPGLWARKRPLAPSPAESNIQVRFFYGTVPLVALLVLSLLVADWLVSIKAAERMLRGQLSSTAQVAAESLPYFTETGQNLILTMATPDLLETSPDMLPDELARRLRSVPFFRQLSLYDDGGELLLGFPQSGSGRFELEPEEDAGIGLALRGVTTQVYIVKPLPGETSAQVSFIAAVRGENEETVRGVLLGRTDLNTNPFTQPVLTALQGLDELQGQGMIISEQGAILFHPDSSQIMQTYSGEMGMEDYFEIQPAPDNTRQYVSYNLVDGRPWAIVITVPVRVAQDLALGIAFPLLLALIVFAAAIFVFLRYSLRAVTSSLQMLAQEAGFISLGQLDRPLKQQGVDEVGRLSAVFEQMRANLSHRLDELNSLLRVSQGVSAHLDIRQAVQPILEAALVEDACAVRLVFVQDVTLNANEHGPVAFGLGPAAQLYAPFDYQLFELVRQQDMLSLPNVPRTRRLQVSPGAPQPGALIAIAIRYENQFHGVLWVAYDHPRNFSEEETRFLSTLASEASLAATNARLYATAEVGRQRLEAVLDSTPEPVLVIDEQARLLLLNPAAMHVPGLILAKEAGQPIHKVVGAQELLRLLTASQHERISSREIGLANGKVYYASVSPVLNEDRPVGKVCILRDITHFKELEQLKSEFVATVSHDLRSPLTLMRGYATMLQMVGDLNEQQKGYVRKIVSGVENMSRLVSNLLDLGRIEAGIGLKIEHISVNDIADDVINSLQLQAVQKDIRLLQEASGANKKLVIDADRALIQQAMYNLVENAIKYTSVGGQVKVRLEGRVNSVLLEIHDTGIGIAPLDLPHLFEKFYRSGRREAYQQRGTGLGLAIVKSIAERHGGRVWVDSQLGKGSTFSLEVPCEQLHAPNGENE
jgi:PAS domain S-box-containing protein